MKDDTENGSKQYSGPKVNRRVALAGMAGTLGALTLAVSEGFDGAAREPAAVPEPSLPCGTLLIGGGNTVGMFNALEKNRLLPGGKNWKEFLTGKKVIGIGCAAGDIHASDEENRISIDKWCKKEDFVMPGKIREFSKEKGLSFYQEHGAEQIAFIKDAAYNKEHQDEIVKAIQDPDTVMFDFSGGDQDLQMKILNQTPRIKEALKQRWIADPNLFVYTTSASAAALSTHMMSEGDIRPGLGWLENIIVDMHMLRNGEHGPDNRVPRLLKQVKEYTKREPDLVGIGVDEATALILKREVRPEGGRPVETMTGTVVASIDDEGKVRSGALGSNRVFLIGKKDCNKPEEQLPTYRPLTGRTNPPPGLSISPDLLAKLTRMPPGQYEGALKTLPDDTQEVIKSALETAFETGRGAGRDR